ncbi:response regulator [Vicingaceae bacterium]|nr:response regulator [Vicingaceae bacterium]
MIVDDSVIDRQLVKGILEKVPGYFALQAENGNDALEKMKEWDVDLVLTDLQMPEMDGLELVRSLRSNYPEVPTILATAYGSEEIATTALAAGAAGYVPKSQLGDLLIPTVRDVLNILYADRSYSRLLNRATETSFEFRLENDASYFPSIIDLCEKMLARLSTMDRIERLRTVVGIEQALSNALFRGNLEIGSSYVVPYGADKPKGDVAEMIKKRISDSRYKERKTYIRFSISNKRLMCTVRDDGPGFSPTADPDISEAAGRGLVLMNAFMDSVEFDKTGNQVTLVRSWTGNGKLLKKGDTAIQEIQGDKSSDELGRLVSSKGGVIELVRRSLVIGRRDSCHIVLPYKEVSPHHCQLYHRDGIWIVRDLKSEKGTRVNGRRVTQKKLRPGDVLAIANYEYKVEYKIQEQE